MPSHGEIFIVDDDPWVRDALTIIFSREGYRVSAFADGGSFLLAARQQVPACVILDIYMPGRSGLKILKDLGAQGCTPAIFVISAHGDVPTAVEAIKHGAVDFIEKPFDANTVVTRVRAGIEARARQATIADDPQFLDVLTPRESEVLDHIVSGESSKEIGRRLGISPRTVETHRERIMEKLKAKNGADLAGIVMRRRSGRTGRGNFL
jgi:FixJ family two-component response regulator